MYFILSVYSSFSSISWFLFYFFFGSVTVCLFHGITVPLSLSQVGRYSLFYICLSTNCSLFSVCLFLSFCRSQLQSVRLFLPFFIFPHPFFILSVFSYLILCECLPVRLFCLALVFLSHLPVVSSAPCLFFLLHIRSLSIDFSSYYLSVSVPDCHGVLFPGFSSRYVM